MATYTGFPDPGSNTNTALDTTSASYIGGSLTSTASLFQDSLTTIDTSDYYKFTLSSSSILNLNLSGLGSDANLILRNSAGSPVVSATNSGNASETIRRSLLSGTYYAQVFLASGSANTTYTLSLSAETIQESGKQDNSIAQANTNNDIGAFSSSGTYNATDYVGSTGNVIDGDDYYKFTLNTSGTVNINLGGLTGDANLELQNSSGNILQSSSQPGVASESINSVLRQGTYYIHVSPYLSVTNYNLAFTFTADAPDLAGNTLGTARNVTLSSNATTYSDVVSQGDTLDYYRFDLASSALVDLRFTSLSADANLQLLNQAGSTIQTSNQTGLALDSIRRSLNSGTYYVLVTPGTTATANYTLSLSATPIGADQAPNGYTSAKDIGTLTSPQSFNDFVGNIDTNDYYKFKLNSNTQFNLSLNNLTDNADVQLLNSLGQVIQTSNQVGNTSESINNTLNAGTYYIRVFTSGLANTFYNLNVSAVPQARLLRINSTGSANPDNLTAWGNNLYFTANDGTSGVQLWKSDGNTNTRLSNFTGFNPSRLIVFNNQLYFTATDSFGTELWQSNGTSVNRVSDINPNAGSSNPGDLTVVGNQLFFSAIDATNARKLWVYNGTNLSLVNVNPGFATNDTTDNPATFTTAFNNRLFFTAKNNTQLWSTDGTVGGTQVISVGGVNDSYARSLTVMGNSLYFTANNGTSGFEIWRYQSGTTANLVKDITPGNNSYAPSNLTSVGNTLYFVTDSDNNFNLELWKTDGTNNGTVRVKSNTNQAPNLGFGAINLTAVGNTLYFVAYDPTSGLELWKTDGTDANTVVVKDIWPGTDTKNQPNNSLPTNLVNLNGTLAFAASDNNANGFINREVWFSDGTATNTLKVTNIDTTGVADPTKLTAVGTRLFFTATDEGYTDLYVI